jgi:thiamine pyrophosphokinase
MRKIIIIANGDNNLEGKDLENLSPFYKIICADGGTRIAFNMGLKPDIIVGDLDSLTDDLWEKVKDQRIELKIYPKEKDETDLELAVKEALKFSPDIIYFIGLIGGRIDHTLSNLLFLERIKKKGIEIVVLDKNLEIYLMTDNEEKILFGKEGEILSLIPISEKVEGIILKGLKYLLNNESLMRDLTRGISNEFIENKAYIKIKSGTLLIIHFLC